MCDCGKLRTPFSYIFPHLLEGNSKIGANFERYRRVGFCAKNLRKVEGFVSKAFFGKVYSVSGLFEIYMKRIAIGTL